jgi:Calcineurin-like phosphoesterase
MSENTVHRRWVAAFLTVIVAAAVPSAARSAPSDNQADNSRRPAWKFAVTDDSRAAGSAVVRSNGVSTLAVGTIANDIVMQGVDFVLFPGDMVTGETNDTVALSSMLDTWVAAMAPVYNSGIPVYVTRGNHEYNPGDKGAANPLDPSRQTYLEHFSYLPDNGPQGEKGLTWSITHKNVKIIGFDQYAGRTASYDNTLYAPGSNKGQAMSSWVLDEINSSNAPLNFVIAHEQIWPSMSHPDCLANDPDSRDALVHALATHNGAYLAGHDHMYVRGYVSNTQGDRASAFVVGTAGGGNYDFGAYDISQWYTGPDAYTVQKHISNSSAPTFGYLLVTVYTDNTWSAEFRGFQFDYWHNVASDTHPVNVGSFSVMDTCTWSAGICQ